MPDPVDVEPEPTREEETEFDGSIDEAAQAQLQERNRVIAWTNKVIRLAHASDDISATGWLAVLGRQLAEGNPAPTDVKVLSDYVASWLPKSSFEEIVTLLEEAGNDALANAMRGSI